MKRISLLVMLLLLMVSPVGAQDEDEGLTVYAILESNAPQAGTFEGAEMHLYAFTGTAGQTVSLNMTSANPDVDPFLILLGADNTLIGFDDDSAGALNALLTATLPEDGLYFVLAGTYRTVYLSEAVEGEYSLTLSGASADISAADALEEANLPEAALDRDIPLALDTENPVYLTVVSVRDSLTLEITALSNTLDTLLYVFNPAGERIGFDDDSAGVGYSAALNNLSLDEPGTYVIIVANRDYLESLTQDTSAGDVTLRLTRY